MTTVYLDPKQVPTQLAAGYTGKKFKARVTESVHIPMTAGLWDGGSCDTYRVVRIADGAAMMPTAEGAAPWDNERKARDIKLEPGFCVIEHSIFCGKDMGLTFHVHPADAAPLLPSTTELDPTEQLVLNATAAFKASYNGRDRYDMATDDLRYARAPYPTRDAWNTAKEALISKGLLTKAGAITTAGRNAVKR